MTFKRYDNRCSGKVVMSLINYFSDWMGSNHLTNIIYIANYFVLALNLVVIMLSAAIAFVAWRATAQHNANEHMHHLFMELLKIRLAHRTAVNDFARASLEIQGSRPSKTEKSEVDDRVYDIAGMKLYVLEEMFSWLTAQRQMRSTIWRFESDRSRKARNDNLSAWDRTIITHALDDFEGTAKSIKDFASCYSIDFLDYIARGTKCSELLLLVANHSEKVEAGEKRPLGLEEQKLANKVAQGNARNSCAG